MMRRILSLVILTILVLGVTSLSAHEEYRIIGTISNLQNSNLQVKNKDGETFSIAMNSVTLIRRDNQTVDATELKTGGSVVVDALGDSLADLVAVEVRIVPAITP